jgi:(p)ppGpp synthase/HD superfamily hydrolase
LHDTVEDTDMVTFERIENEFGVTVRRIVEGETKVHCFTFYILHMAAVHVYIWYISAKCL